MNIKITLIFNVKAANASFWWGDWFQMVVMMMMMILLLASFQGQSVGCSSSGKTVVLLLLFTFHVLKPLSKSLKKVCTLTSIFRCHSKLLFLQSRTMHENAILLFSSCICLSCKFALIFFKLYEFKKLLVMPSMKAKPHWAPRQVFSPSSQGIFLHKLTF